MRAPTYEPRRPESGPIKHGSNISVPELGCDRPMYKDGAEHRGGPLLRFPRAKLQGTKSKSDASSTPDCLLIHVRQLNTSLRAASLPHFGATIQKRAALSVLPVEPRPLFRDSRSRRHGEQEVSLASVKDDEVLRSVKERSGTVRIDRVSSRRQLIEPV